MPAGINYYPEFPEEYIENAFFVWYRLSKGVNASAEAAKIVKQLPPTSDGRKPLPGAISRWARKYDWRARVDALDAEVAVKLEKEAIQERVKTLKQLAKDGNALKMKGMEYIENHKDPFADNPSAAVRAIVAGAEMEWRYAGQASILEGISDMSNKKLESEILRLLGKSSEENENTIDATLEDIPTEEDENAESEDDNTGGE